MYTKKAACFVSWISIAKAVLEYLGFCNLAALWASAALPKSFHISNTVHKK